MESFETKIKILIDLVTQKNEMLEILHNIVTNQRTLLELIMTTTHQLTDEQALEIKQIFSDMILEKERQITKINESDQVFAKLFESLDNFEAQAQNHKELVRTLQQLVQVTTELDVSVRVAENENERMITEKNLRNEGFKSGTSLMKTEKVDTTPVSKKKIMDSYKNNKDFKK